MDTKRAKGQLDDVSWYMEGQDDRIAELEGKLAKSEELLDKQIGITEELVDEIDQLKKDLTAAADHIQ